MQQPREEDCQGHCLSQASGGTTILGDMGPPSVITNGAHQCEAHQNSQRQTQQGQLLAKHETSSSDEHLAVRQQTRRRSPLTCLWPACHLNNGQTSNKNQMKQTNDTDQLKQTYQADSQVHPTTTTKKASKHTRSASLRAYNQLMILFAFCFISVYLQTSETASAPAISTTDENQLAKQLIDIHQRNQIVNYIQNQVTANQRLNKIAGTNLWDHQEHQATGDHNPNGDRSSNSNKETQHGAWLSSLNDHPSRANQHEDERLEMQTNQLLAADSSLNQKPPSRPTTPTLSKQLAGPDVPYYEFGLATTNALQLDMPLVQDTANEKQMQQQQQYRFKANDLQTDRPQHHRYQHIVNSAPIQEKPWQLVAGQQRQTILSGAESVASPQFVLQDDHHQASPFGHSSPREPVTSNVAYAITTMRPRDSRSMFSHDSSSSPSPNFNARKLSESDLSISNTNQPSDSSRPADGGNETSDSKRINADDNTERSQSSRAPIESRQRRRIFNRILKKAEWNHLFLELSKVFLRYFLDLALKDIIGKQSGSTGGSDGSTTGRKKLDAQSELTDMLKDFIKTAISNI